MQPGQPTLPPCNSKAGPKSASAQLFFYQFLGAHSLLIGLFPFFIPVWLWKLGFSLPQICLFIAGTGFTFCLALRLWEIAANKLSILSLLLLSFLFELVIVALALRANTSSAFLIPFALANGLYNCFFWTTQRCLFLQLVTSKNSGRQYGNLQIFVTLFLKGGILCGGLLLEHSGFLALFALSTALTAIMMGWFYYRNSAISAMTLHPASVVSLKEILTFKDALGSRRVFTADGLFLFLESHLWTISLFFLSKQNFAKFGIIVILLAAVFGVIFYLTKNTIDRFAGSYLFKVAVLLYALGWLLRTIISEDTDTHWMITSLLMITFCTSFFRLVFNKRFFDIANSSSGTRYLVIKSYYTQASVCLAFILLAAIASVIEQPIHSLQIVYALAALCSIAYFAYKAPGKAPGKDSGTAPGS